ncbi:MAG: hypothetical protein GX801_01680 [Fibrobacter sp.]|nr:hypothetical protein [Fibrobacter sp.]
MKTENIIIVAFLVLFRCLDLFSTHYFVNDFEATEINIFISVFKMNGEAFIIGNYIITPIVAIIAYLILHKDLSQQISAYQFQTVLEFMFQAFRPVNSWSDYLKLFAGVGIKNKSLYNWILVKMIVVSLVFAHAYAVINNMFLAEWFIPLFFKSYAPLAWTIQFVIIMILLVISSVFVTIKLNTKQARRSYGTV